MPYEYPHLCNRAPTFRSQHAALEFVGAFQSAGYIKPCAKFQVSQTGGYTSPREYRLDCHADSFHCVRSSYPYTGRQWAWYGCPSNCRLYVPRPDALSGPTATLEQQIRSRDIPAVKDELDRALKNVEADPPAAITAACAVLESMFKVIIADEGLALPSDQSVIPLWRVVQGYLNLDPADGGEPVKKMLGGLASVVHGVAELRTQVGSAHGRGPGAASVEPHHARLAVNSAHTLVVFVLETWR